MIIWKADTLNIEDIPITPRAYMPWSRYPLLLILGSYLLFMIVMTSTPRVPYGIASFIYPKTTPRISSLKVNSIKCSKPRRRKEETILIIGGLIF